MVQEYLSNEQRAPQSVVRTFLLMGVFAVGFAHPVCAQEWRWWSPIAPEPAGSGARALGQSAFIAVADDATAAAWNPAGLINLDRPQASVVGAWKSSTNDYSSTNPAVVWTDQDSWSAAEINFMSYVQPLTVGNTDLVLSINYHQVYDLGAKGSWSKQVEGIWERSEVSCEGAVSAYSIAGAIAMPSHPEIAIGATFNWYARSLLNDYAWQVKSQDQLWAPFFDEPLSALEARETVDEFSAYNFAFGLLWDVYEREKNLLTLGFVCHTPFTANANLEVLLMDAGLSPPLLFNPQRIKIDFPLSLGAGVNYRLSDSLSTALDVEWTQWSELAYTDAYGHRFSLAGDDALAVRWGAEHLIFFQDAGQSVLACRGGLLYEPRPTPNSSDLLSVYGFSLGLGWTTRQRFSLDFAYQFRWGEEVIEDVELDRGFAEHLFVTSLITYF